MVELAAPSPGCHAGRQTKSDQPANRLLPRKSAKSKPITRTGMQCLCKYLKMKGFRCDADR